MRDADLSRGRRARPFDCRRGAFLGVFTFEERELIARVLVETCALKKFRELLMLRLGGC